jgi:predicted GNAT family N-acyltransferase
MNETKIIKPQETYPLRLGVLWPHFERLDQCGIDVDEVEGTFHVGAFKDGEVVSIATFLVQKSINFEEEKQYRLRAMATSPKVRGESFGKEVIDFAIKELKKRKIKILWCDARKVALGFYEKMGFTVIGDYYDVPKIGAHKLMFYNII